MCVCVQLLRSLFTHPVPALEVRGETHVAGGAVEEVVPTSDSADAAALEDRRNETTQLTI